MSSTETHLFYNLTPDIILDAVSQTGLEVSGHIAQLNSMENRVFDLRLESGAHVIAKFYRPQRWSREQILEEHRFVKDLAEEEVNVLTPLVLRDETVFKTQNIFFTLWPRKGGREPEEISDIDLQILARLTARLHNCGEKLPFAERPPFSSGRLLLEPLEILQKKGFLHDEIIDEYRSLVTQCITLFQEAIEPLPKIRIHGDLHKGNILNGQEGYFLLDFDDALMGPALQDVWMLCPRHDLARRQIFLDAYREFREFEESWFRSAELFRAVRIVHYSGWIARRYEDPAFKAAFPAFATAAYWQEEITILADILNSYSDFSEVPVSPKLTNRDYFFDL